MSGPVCRGDFCIWAQHPRLVQCNTITEKGKTTRVSQGNNTARKLWDGLKLKWWSLYLDRKEKSLDNFKNILKKRFQRGLFCLTFPKCSILSARSNLNVISIDKLFCLPVYNSCQSVCFVFLNILFCFCLFRIDEHFKTSPKIPGIDLNSTRVLFEKLMNSQHSVILEQVCSLRWQSACLKVHFFFHCNTSIFKRKKETNRQRSCINLNSKILSLGIWPTFHFLFGLNLPKEMPLQSVRSAWAELFDFSSHWYILHTYISAWLIGGPQWYNAWELRIC